MKIAIVEDERLEREAIKLLLSRMHIPIDIVYESFHGEDAVRLFRIHRPHLVLMDIQIPRLSGLEAARQIRAIDPDASVVMLTAFSDFAYAQQALQLGAVDYLLKPYNEEKLYDAVLRVERRLTAQRMQQERQKGERSLLSNVHLYMKQELFYFLVAGKVTDSWAEDFLRDYFRLDAGSLRCVLLRTGVLAEAQSTEICRLLKAAFRPLLCRPLDRDIVLLLQGDAGGEIEKAVAAAVAPGLDADRRAALRCAKSAPENDLQKLAAAFRRLREQLDGQEEEKELRSKRILNMYGLESQFYHSILRCDWEKCRQLLMQLGAIAEDINRGEAKHTRSYFGHLWRQVDRFIYQTTGRRKCTEVKLSIDAELEKADTLEQMVERLMSFLQWYGDALELDRRAHSRKMIEEVKEYVNLHLSENISLEQVAERVGLSSFYLSKLFKKVEGVSFKNYVIAARMEKAKQLLCGSDMKINQVSSAVGYSDANYFSRAFRDYSGISAKDFSGR